MKKMKGIVSGLILVACLAGIVVGKSFLQNWPARYSAELDRFFGEGNWECIDEETKESIIYSEYVVVRSNPALSGEVAGKFKNWYIRFDNREGEEEIWYITNHTMKINQDEYWLLSPKRYSGKQALTLELMDVSFGAVGEEIMEDVIRQELTDTEAGCIEVTMSYDGGNPEPEFYDSLAKEKWFTVNDVTAGDYLACDLHDFYIMIRAHDYRLEKLTAQEQQNVLDSLEPIIRTLCEKYGEDASFWIYFDEAHKTEYRNGKKIEE